jgi:hypothetical protein
MTDPPSASPGRKALQITLQLAITAAITVFLFRIVGMRLDDVLALDRSAWRPAWGVLFLSSLVLLMAYLYSAGLWGLMVRDLGGPKIGFLRSCQVFFVANLGRYLPGKLWQIAGLAYLARGEGVTASTAVAAALLGQALALTGATLVGLPVLLQGEWGLELGAPWIAGAVALVVLILTFPGVVRWGLGVWFRLARGEFPDGWRPPPLFGLRWAVLYGAGWVAQGIGFWMLARSFGLSLDPAQAASAYAAAYLLGYLVLPAPAGIGVREGFLALFLEPVLGVGVAPLAVLARLWTTLVELVPALAFGASHWTGGRKGESSGA